MTMTATKGTITMARNKRSRSSMMLPSRTTTTDKKNKFAARALLVLCVALVGTVFLDTSSPGAYLRSAGGNSRRDGRNAGGRKLFVDDEKESNDPLEPRGEGEYEGYGTRRRNTAFFGRWARDDSNGEDKSSFQDHADVIHTYVPSIHHGTGRILFASEANPDEETIRRRQQDMLDVWRKVWEERGWRVRYVTDHDARFHGMFHANFDAWDALLRQSDEQEARMSERKKDAVKYFYVQYLRFLAMSNVGGGYLSDVDVAPLTQPAQTDILAHENERFTIYYTRNGATPNLVSATEEDYERAAAEFLRRAQSYVVESTSDEREGIDIWRDLVQMEESNGDRFFTVKDSVVCTDDIIANNGEGGGRDLTLRECGSGDELKAVHFGAGALFQSADEQNRNERGDPLQGAGAAVVMREWADRFGNFCDDMRRKEGQDQDRVPRHHQQQKYQEGNEVVGETPPVGKENAEEDGRVVEGDGSYRNQETPAMAPAERYRMKTASIATEMLSNFREKQHQ